MREEFSSRFVRFLGVWVLFGGSLGCSWASELPAPPSLAQGRALAAQNRCLACHEIDARRVGPPFRAIAKRFGRQPAAAPVLAQAMRQGSSGQWGAIPMPAQTRLSQADALLLARWILSLPAQ
ncbi:MAG TPA: c-type cytochrome [Castellaniella sp.]|uniref:c-type cytochrome n=1 Tax=Castellaniella sp. TaxID=1955812 RepID=UPI002EF4554A